MNYLDLSIADIHAALVTKKVPPLELTKEALNRAHESKDNAFEMILDDEAIAFASSLGEPEEDNLLWGIPYLAKDNFSTKGLPTTASSNVLNGYKPLFDAYVIDVLKQKKTVLIGKTTLDELAMGGTGTTGHLGITYNPYDPKHERMMGGSSCGSAAAVAAGIVPFALGSDTGDSVRKPASYGGIIGVKPTWGRISRYGLFPFAPSLDHVGFFTRYVSDAALLCDVLSGRDEMDSTSSEKPVPHCLEKLGEEKKPTFAVLSDIVDSIHDETILSSFAKSWRSRGARLLIFPLAKKPSNRSTRPISSSLAPRRPATMPISTASSSAPITKARRTKKLCSTPGPRVSANLSSAASSSVASALWRKIRTFCSSALSVTARKSLQKRMKF